MNRYLWVVVIGVLVLAAFGTYQVYSPMFQATPDNVRGIVVMPMRMVMEVQNLTVGTDKQSGFPKLTLHQGDAGSLRLVFTRQYTAEKVTVKLRFYGISPDFDIWLYGDDHNASLPEGITSSIDPSMLELSTDTPCSADLTIVASTNAQIGDFKLMVNVRFSPSGTGSGESTTGKSFMLEIAPKT
jgi:hypothetical protein